MLRLPLRLALVTLGVADIAASRAFHERLGFCTAGFDSPDVVFCEITNGVTLALFGRRPLAEDAHVAPDGTGFRDVSCAVNLESSAEVDQTMAFAAQSGATITKSAQEVFWGGYSSYFADLDGHLWEVACNPHWPVDETGRMKIAPVAGTNA